MDLISSYNSILLFLKAYNENWPLGAIVTAFRDPTHFVRLGYRHCYSETSLYNSEASAAKARSFPPLAFTGDFRNRKMG